MLSTISDTLSSAQTRITLLRSDARRTFLSTQVAPHATLRAFTGAPMVLRGSWGVYGLARTWAARKSRAQAIPISNARMQDGVHRERRQRSRERQNAPWVGLLDPRYIRWRYASHSVHRCVAEAREPLQRQQIKRSLWLASRAQVGRALRANTRHDRAQARFATLMLARAAHVRREFRWRAPHATSEPPSLWLASRACVPRARGKEEKIDRAQARRAMRPEARVRDFSFSCARERGNDRCCSCRTQVWAAQCNARAAYTRPCAGAPRDATRRPRARLGSRMPRVPLESLARDSRAAASAARITRAHASREEKHTDVEPWGPETRQRRARKQQRAREDDSAWLSRGPAQSRLRAARVVHRWGFCPPRANKRIRLNEWATCARHPSQVYCLVLRNNHNQAIFIL